MNERDQYLITYLDMCLQGILADLSPMFILVGRKEKWRIMAAGRVDGK